MKSWLFLAVAILAEVMATSSLKLSDGFSRLGPSVLVVLGYGISFFCLSMTLKTIPVGMVYAIWSGLGIVLVTSIAWVLFDQKLDLPALVGMGLIILGVLVMNLFSQAARHA